MLTLAQTGTSVGASVAMQIFLIVIGCLMTVVGTLIVMMLKGLKVEVAGLSGRVHSIEIKNASNDSILQTAATREYVDGRLTAVESMLSKMDSKLTKVCEGVQQLQRFVDTSNVRIEHVEHALEELREA